MTQSLTKGNRLQQHPLHGSPLTAWVMKQQNNCSSCLSSVLAFNDEEQLCVQGGGCLHR